MSLTTEALLAEAIAVAATAIECMEVDAAMARYPSARAAELRKALDDIKRRAPWNQPPSPIEVDIEAKCRAHRNAWHRLSDGRWMPMGSKQPMDGDATDIRVMWRSALKAFVAYHGATPYSGFGATITEAVARLNAMTKET